MLHQFSKMFGLNNGYQALNINDDYTIVHYSKNTR